MLKNFDITIPIQDQLPKPDNEKGVIYYLYCNSSKKGYIGQAANYVSGNVKWGTIGRWKSHVREATSGKKDHCLLLNQAIRKYGVNSFTVTTVKEVLLNELDQLESYYIETFNTLAPNGYNLEKGGREGKILSEETKKKLSQFRKGTTRPPEECKKISDGQLGLRRNIKQRKFQEDSSLPKYIYSARRNNVLIGYHITFPIGIDQKKYIDTAFHNRKNPSKALEDAKKYLDDLKLKYAYVEEEVAKRKEERLKQYQKEKIENKVKKGLPQYIYPIIKNNKINGYYVEGYLDDNNNPYPKKEFTELVSNSRNLRAAKRYIESLEVLNKNNNFREKKLDDLINVGNHNYSEKRRKNGDTANLPKYLTYVIVNGEKIGYQVNNFPMSKNEKIKKKFCGKKIPMEEKYKQATDYLKELWDKKKKLENNQSKDKNNDNNTNDEINTDNENNEYSTDDDISDL